MPRKFNYQSIEYAWRTQCPIEERGLGSTRCKRCGKKIETYHKEDKWFPCQIIPAEDGGRFNKENCIIVCENCYLEITEKRQELLKTLPSDSLYDDS